MRIFASALLLACCCVASCLTVTAQQSFEGTIHYKVTGVESPKDKESIIEAAFGKQGIRLRMIADGVADKEVLLFRFDSAALFTLNADHKEYKVSPLNPPAGKTTTHKDIAGHKTTSLDLNPLEHGSPLGQTDKLILHLADDLFYTLPPAIGYNSSLFFIQNGHIALAVEMPKNAVNGDAGPGASSDSMVIAVSAEAFKIDPAPLDADILAIPAGYTKSKPEMPVEYPDVRDTSMYDGSDLMTDSLATTVDTVALPPVMAEDVKPVKARKPAAPVKRKTTKPAPARKPE